MRWLEGQRGPHQSSGPRSWLVDGSGNGSEWWTRPVIQAEGPKKEDERGWITHERGGSFWKRSRMWAQSEQLQGQGGREMSGLLALRGYLLSE